MKKFLIFSVLFSGIIISAVLISGVFAQEDSGNAGVENIKYPVAELGNCKNEAACRAFCDKPQNMEICVAFAEKNNLMSDEEIEMAKKFMAAGGEGPGGCRGKEECEAFCDNIDNIKECVAFAEEHNLMPPKELEEAKKVKAAIERGVKPPACGNKKRCDAYCGQPENMEECIIFAEAAGFIPPEELEDVKKVLAAIKKGIKPPACRGKEECDIYCSDDAHFNECIAFAEAAGFIPPEELDMIRKTGGKGPGGCRGKEQCEKFCEKEENMEICAQFALEHGLMKPEEMEMFKKTGGKGPGECRGKEECEAFCKNPDNQEECFDFANKNGFIDKEEMEKMRKEFGDFKDDFREFKSPPGRRENRPQMAPRGGIMMDFEHMPAEIAQCLKSKLGENIIEEMKLGRLRPGQEIEQKIGECMKNFTPRQDMPVNQNNQFNKKLNNEEEKFKEEIEPEFYPEEFKQEEFQKEPYLEQAPPPSSVISPHSLLGLIFSIFLIGY